MTDPTKKLGEYEDVSKVDKYDMPEDEYAKRTDSVRLACAHLVLMAVHWLFLYVTGTCLVASQICNCVPLVCLEKL